MRKFVEDHGKEYEMTNCGRYPVWLKGSRRTIERTIYAGREDKQEGNSFTDKCFVKWGENYVEVKRATMGFVTIEEY